MSFYESAFTFYPLLDCNLHNYYNIFLHIYLQLGLISLLPMYDGVIANFPLLSR